MDIATIDVAEQRLLAEFETGGLPPAALDHRTHLRLGWSFLRRHGDLAAGALAFRRALRAWTRAHGAAARYHETITWAYLCVLEQHRAAAPSLAFDELVATEPALLDHRNGALARHYDVAALAACPHAARTFVLPARSAR